MTNFEWIEIGEIFSFVKGKIQSSELDYINDGECPVISIAKENKFVNNIDNTLILEKKDHIFIVTGGNKRGETNFDYQSVIKYYPVNMLMQQTCNMYP